MGAKVFLSYAHADRAAAEVVARQLDAVGLDVWFDVDQLQTGDNWALALGRALEDSDALVVLLSPDAMASRHVQLETQHALLSARYKNRVIPVVVRPTRNVPWILRRFHMLDLKTEGDVGGRIAEIIAATRPRSGARRRIVKRSHTARVAG